MRWRAIGLLVLWARVTGCGPTIWYAYSKPGINEAQCKQDESQCEDIMTYVRREVPRDQDPLGYYYSRDYLQALVNRCMVSRGYKIQEIHE